LYGLHPNAEIEFLTTLSENLFRTVFEMQPRDAGAGGGAGVSREEKVRHLQSYFISNLFDGNLFSLLKKKAFIKFLCLFFFIEQWITLYSIATASVV
jgi:hypothetical protein